MSFQPTIRVALMRGLHGSGKSFAAAKIKEAFGLSMCHVYSTDDFFTYNGVYKFITNKVGEYHSRNLIRYVMTLQSFAHHYNQLQGDACIVVDNCNMLPPNIEPYFWTFRQCSRMFANVPMSFNLVDPETDWQYDIEECARRSIHGVTLESLRTQVEHANKYDDEIFSKYNTGKKAGTTPVSDFISTVRKTIHQSS